MNKIYLIILCFTFSLFGCFNKDKTMETILKAEELYLQIKMDEGIELLEGISKKDSLPDKYYEVLSKLYLRKFSFQKSFLVLQEWNQKNKKDISKIYKNSLLALLRFYAEQKTKGLKYEAIKALGELKDYSSKNLIMNSFNYKSRTIRLTVCYAMTLLGDGARSLPYIKDRALYSSLKSRFLASVFLTQLKSIDLKDAYISMLQDPDERIQVLGIKIIGELKIKEALSKIKKLYDLSGSSYIKLMSAQALVRLGQDYYKESLEKLKSNKFLSNSAKILLAELGDSSVLESLKSSIETLSLEEKFSLYQVLLSLDEKEFVISQLKKSLTSLVGETIEKKMALEIIYNTNEKTLKKEVELQLASPFEEIQILASKTLIKLLS